MGSTDLSKRRNWQKISGGKAVTAEQDFYTVFRRFFDSTEYIIEDKPPELRSIYVDIPLSDSEIKQIYNPPERITRHGITPDYAITNQNTHKKLYVEVKRQDGWVEGKHRSAGRGNAHERLCKYFTPGLLKILSRAGKIDYGDSGILPFWVVFIGDITRDPCRVREINCWFDTKPEHFFFWRDQTNPQPLIDHFIDKLSHYIDR